MPLTAIRYLGIISKIFLCNPLEAGLDPVLCLLKDLLTHIHETYSVTRLCCHLCTKCVYEMGMEGGWKEERRKQGRQGTFLCKVISFPSSQMTQPNARF